MKEYVPLPPTLREWEDILSSFYGLLDKAADLAISLGYDKEHFLMKAAKAWDLELEDKEDEHD